MRGYFKHSHAFKYGESDVTVFMTLLTSNFYAIQHNVGYYEFLTY